MRGSAETVNSLSVVPSRTRAQLRRDRNASSVAPGDDSPDRFQQQRRRPLRGRRGGRDHLGEGQAGLPDGYSQIVRWYAFGPSGFWTMVPLCYTAKFDPFLSLDCARVEGVGAQSKKRKGSNFAAQRSEAIVLQAPRAKHLQSKNLAIAIWQP